MKFAYHLGPEDFTSRAVEQRAAIFQIDYVGPRSKVLAAIYEWWLGSVRRRYIIATRKLKCFYHSARS
jgi:hypothetical protein